MEKTAMEQLVQYIEEFTPKNKTTDGIWSKAKSLIEQERQQIINAFNDGYRSGHFKDHRLGSKYYEEYYE